MLFTFEERKWDGKGRNKILHFRVLWSKAEGLEKFHLGFILFFNTLKKFDPQLFVMPLWPQFRMPLSFHVLC